MAVEKTMLSGEVLEESTDFTLGDLCRACSAHAEWLVELIEEGIVEPCRGDTAHWRFTGTSLRRARTVRRLQRDLGVNLAGAALALELIDQIEALRARLAALESQD